ncbi:Cytochrome P450 [Mycena indigotica]|uniref:Cytochrome P450 n=1 Tax=Mycena indigotica TaxID=2126181 RepID=A0A8H6TF70_9AGAR|nr:Cytochrome P450 [Mycena indigotica]KAF7316410.1 Cytochrome P450 [Mycena indigotica]
MLFTFFKLTSPLAGVVAILAVALFTRILRGYKHRSPPGPSGWPIVGNLFDLPPSTNEPWKVYQAWSVKYGSDVIHMKVLATRIIVINLVKAASDLLTQKSAIYADRPRMPMLQEAIGLGWHFGFMPYGDGWRQHRRLFAQHTGTFTIAKQLKWTNILLENLLSSPHNFIEHIQHFATGSSLEATFGIQVNPSGTPDPFIEAAKQVVQSMVEAGIFGSYLVDYLPFLKHVERLKGQVKEWSIASNVAAHVPWDAMTKAVQLGDFSPSAASELFESDNLDQTIARQTLASMFASGSAATASTITIFLLAMRCKKLRKSRSTVVGDRLPELSDEVNLPYITALIREIGRWNPVVPLAFPHMLSTDDEYDGHHLKAGTIVVPNSWAILHDPEVYSEPESFNPSRFLTRHGLLNPLVNDPEAVWGYGRRACPGRRIAASELFLTISGILKVFKITPAVNNESEVIQPKCEFGSGLLRYPKPFKCSIEPRSKEVVELIQLF